MLRLYLGRVSFVGVVVFRAPSFGPPACLVVRSMCSNIATMLSANEEGTSHGTREENSTQLAGISQRPNGFLRLYYSPLMQVVMLGFVCFMCPGLFNALNGMGA